MADRRGTGVPLPMPTRRSPAPLTHALFIRSPAHPLTRSAQGARRLLREVWHDRLHELVVRNNVGRDHEHPAHSASVQRRRLGVWRVRRAAASPNASIQDKVAAAKAQAAIQLAKMTS